jgi:membrane protease YdiL (CAAX protease family)
VSDVPFQDRPEVPQGIVPGPLPRPQRPPAGRGLRHDAPAFRWWTPFVALLATFLAASVVVGLTIVFVEASGTRVDSDDLPSGIVIGGTLVQDAVLIVFAVLFAGLGGRRPTAWTFGFRPTAFWKAVGWAAVVAVGFYVFSFIWAVALGIKENDDLAEQLGAKDSTLNLVLVTLMVTIAAPLTEELFFRGFLFPAVSNAIGWIGGAIVTGVIFGGIHAGGTDPEFLVPLMVFGGGLCVLYRMTGSLLPCIALHALNNAIALSVTLEWEAWQIAAALVLAPCVVMAIAVPLARRGPRTLPAHA